MYTSSVSDAVEAQEVHVQTLETGCEVHNACVCVCVCVCLPCSQCYMVFCVVL